jgi:hypothetical protein
MQAEVVWHGALWRQIEPPVVAPPAPKPSGDTLELVLAALADGREWSMSAVQEHIHRGYHGVRDTLRDLEAGGQVERVLLSHGRIRYRVAR